MSPRLKGLQTGGDSQLSSGGINLESCAPTLTSCEMLGSREGRMGVKLTTPYTLNTRDSSSVYGAEDSIMQQLWLIFALAGTSCSHTLRGTSSWFTDTCVYLWLITCTTPVTHRGLHFPADVIFLRPPPTLWHLIHGCSSTHLMTPQMKFRRILPIRR